jgi:hypothetical protein
VELAKAAAYPRGCHASQKKTAAKRKKKIVLQWNIETLQQNMAILVTYIKARTFEIILY